MIRTLSTNVFVRRAILRDMSMLLVLAMPVACAHSHPHVEKSCIDATNHASLEPHSHGQLVEPAPAPGPVRAQTGGTAAVVSHESLPSFENQGNSLRGVATASQGARSYEVWRTSVAVGSRTPLHTHESEEVFIFLQGKGQATIGDQVFEFSAPATVIAPAGIAHQFVNIGDVPTDAIVVVGIGSSIYDADGKLMQLPWRK